MRPLQKQRCIFPGVSGHFGAASPPEGRKNKGTPITPKARGQTKKETAYRTAGDTSFRT